jgi:S1-C subfamily serine protease
MAGRRVVNLSRSDTVDVGEQITFWGFPAGHNGNEPLFTAGYVSGSDNKAVYPDGNELKPFGSTLLVLNAGVNPGNSGSPVIRVSEGSIIGMVIRKSVPSTDIGYIVPSAAIAAFLRGINIDP